MARFVLYKETASVSFRQSMATRNLFVALRYFAMLRRVVKGFARKMTPRGGIKKATLAGICSNKGCWFKIVGF